MEDGLPIFEGTHMAENILQNLAGFKGILAHPVGLVGIGADSDDLAAQFFKTPENIRRGQIAAAAVYAAGVHFHALSLGSQNL